MSCNPAIGGVAKGQIVREIDALGGAMGRAIDATGIQFRMLNRRKGPAMHGPRAQADKQAYQQEIKRIVEAQPGLTLRQETVEDLLVEDGERRRRRAERIVGVARRAATPSIAPAPSSSATGTFLQALLHIGETTTARRPHGRSRPPPASAARSRGWASSWPASRPARRRGSTAARSTTPRPSCSRATTSPSRSRSSPTGSTAEQLPCWITYTNASGPRADPRQPAPRADVQRPDPVDRPALLPFDRRPRSSASPTRTAHQLFLEPEGRHTHEVYVNGLSTSLPRDVQDAMLRLIPGLEHAEILRYGYADRVRLRPARRSCSRRWKRSASPACICAGQINGTTGYEEAAAQGLIAGANAALALQRRRAAGARPRPGLHRRDDRRPGDPRRRRAVSHVHQPGRVSPAAAARQRRPPADAAGHDGSAWSTTRAGNACSAKEAEIARATRLLETRTTARRIAWPSCCAARRSTWADIVGRVPAAGSVSRRGGRAGDLRREVRRLRRPAGDRDRPPAAAGRAADSRRLSTSRAIAHLRAEAREKLARVRPANLAQAGRISGITPADLALLLIHLEG